MKLFVCSIICFLFLLMSCFKTSLSATEEIFEKDYKIHRITVHKYPRQLIALRESFKQKVQIWENIHKRRMHPIDLVFPYIKEVKDDEEDSSSVRFVIEGFSVINALFEECKDKTKKLSKEKKKLVHDVIVASHMWKRNLNVLRLHKNFDKYDSLFMFQALLEVNRLGNRGSLGYNLKSYYIFGYPYRANADKKRILKLLETKKSFVTPEMRIFVSSERYIKPYLNEDEFKKIDLLIHISKIVPGSPPIDLPLYGLREEPPLDPRPGGIEGMWKSLRGIKRPVPACLRDPSVMEGEGPYLDKIPPKGFSVFAHAFPGLRDEILGFEAYGMDRGPAIYRGLMDPPPYPVVMLADMERLRMAVYGEGGETFSSASSGAEADEGAASSSSSSSRSASSASASSASAGFAAEETRAEEDWEN